MRYLQQYFFRHRSTGTLWNKAPTKTWGNWWLYL